MLKMQVDIQLDYSLTSRRRPANYILCSVCLFILLFLAWQFSCSISSMKLIELNENQHYTMNDLFSLDPFDFGEAQDVDSLLQGYWSDHGANRGTQNHLLESEEWGDSDYLCSQYSFYQNNTTQQVVQLPDDQPLSISDFELTTDLQLHIVSPPTKLSPESPKQVHVPTKVVETKKVKLRPISSAALTLLNKYTRGQKRLNREELHDKFCETKSSSNGFHRRLSTETVMKIAGSWYIQFSGQKDDDPVTPSHPLSCFISGLDEEETKDVELVRFLLVSAEKVGNQLFYLANKVLTQCDHLSASTSSNPVQRVVYYFAKALRERINQQIGIIPLNGVGEKERQQNDIDEKMMSFNPVLLAFHQELPFSQVVTFAGVQAIVENVANEKKVHVIDLGVRTGMHWTILIQALASRYENPLEFLKITAVGKTTQRTDMEETGKRLSDFADTTKLKFSFMVKIVSDIEELDEDLLVFETDEAVVVYAPMLLRTMLVWPDRLETLMRVITNLEPCLMVVTEMEGNLNSSSFFNRFIETLFFYGALFDCVDATTNENNQNKMNALGASFGEAILNIVAMEDEERTIRCVGIHVWRSFFRRFRIEETKLSQTCLDQASLILRKFSTERYCTLSMNGECLTVGWKGTPIQSVSAWKFR